MLGSPKTGREEHWGEAELLQILPGVCLCPHYACSERAKFSFQMTASNMQPVPLTLLSPAGISVKLVVGLCKDRAGVGWCKFLIVVTNTAVALLRNKGEYVPLELCFFPCFSFSLSPLGMFCSFLLVYPCSSLPPLSPPATHRLLCPDFSSFGLVSNKEIVPILKYDIIWVGLILWLD